MAESVQYVTNPQGERIGVFLDIAAYNRLTQPLGADSDCLVGLSVDELKALAHCKLALVNQMRLNELIDKNHHAQLSETETHELDDLLVQADQLTVLKARAHYTLQRLDALAAAS